MKCIAMTLTLRNHLSCSLAEKMLLHFYISYSLLNCISYLNVTPSLVLSVILKAPKENRKANTKNKKNDHPKTVPHKLPTLFPSNKLGRYLH